MQIPETRYAPSGELSIAYQVHGDGDHGLLFSGTTASNVEMVRALPEARCAQRIAGDAHELKGFDEPWTVFAAA